MSIAANSPCAHVGRGGIHRRIVDGHDQHAVRDRAGHGLGKFQAHRRFSSIAGAVIPARPPSPGSRPWRGPRSAPPPARPPSPENAGRSPRDRPAPMPLRLARYSALSVKYQVIVVMCCGPAPASARTATTLASVWRDLADKIVGLELLLRRSSRPGRRRRPAARARRRRWRSRPASPSLRAAGSCASSRPSNSSQSSVRTFHSSGNSTTSSILRR